MWHASCGCAKPKPDPVRGASPRTALIAGATGLVGGHLARLLIADPAYAHVVTLGRRNLPADDPRHTHHIVDFDDLEASRDLLACDDAFCALGTTIKSAGSKEAFRRVDLEYVRSFARQARLAGAQRFALVSSHGADPNSFAFYTRVKGEAERAVADEPFRAVCIARPSLLLGDRDEDRMGERLAQRILGALSPVLRGPLANLRPIHAGAAARALVATVQNGPDGVRVYEPRHLHRLSDDSLSADALLGRDYFSR